MSSCSPRRDFLSLPPAAGAGLLVVVVLLVGILGYNLTSQNPLLVDEGFHLRQVTSFRQGVWEHEPGLSNLPGYHFVLTATSWLTDTDSLNGLRLHSLVLALLSLPIVFAIGRKLDPGGATLLTASFFFFPLLLPFNFLLYTDPFGVVCVLLSLLLVLHDRLWASALVASFGVAVRQPQITWMLFVFLVGYVRRYGASLNLAACWDYLRRGWLFPAGFAAFTLFVLVNGGVAMGDRAAHPAGTFYPGNLFFTLFLCGVLFLPLHVANLPRIAALLRDRPWWLLIVAAAAPLLWFGTHFDHQYNQWSFGLHNKVLLRVVDSAAWRCLFFLGVALTVLSLAVTEMKEASFSLLYPFVVLNLAPSWLVEPRYALPSLALFLILRRRRSPLVEGACLGWSVLLSLFFLVGTAQQWFFL